MLFSSARESIPSTSFNDFSIETSFVAPLTIRAASCCIFSNSFASYCVQLFKTTSAYSSNGLINEKKDDL